MAEGNLVRSGEFSDGMKFDVYEGSSFQRALECNQLWSMSLLEVLEIIENEVSDESEILECIAEVQAEDSHWDWFGKTAAMTSEEYIWFYLVADGKPQGACVVFHPKQSSFDGDQIFYIEFVAVAPWNRHSRFRSKKYSGVGSTLLASASSFIADRFGYRNGFSLHALPQAKSYYEKIGMQHISEEDKDLLCFYEMPERSAKKFLDGVFSHD